MAMQMYQRTERAPTSRLPLSRAPFKRATDKKPSKILWAIDALASDDFGLDSGAKASHVLSQIWKCPVEPVYILSPDSLDFPGDFSYDWVKTFTPQVKEALLEKTDNIAGMRLLDPKVLVSRVSTKRKELGLLLRYAKQSGSAPLVLTTHGRTGLSRWMLGSFAEIALLVAQTPLLITSPASELSSIKKVLFPTNLSRASKSFIRRQIPWLKANDVAVVIYKKLTNAVDPFIHSGMAMAGGGWVSLQALMQEESLKSQQEGEMFCRELVSRGLNAKFVLGGSASALSEGVLDIAEAEKADVIALLSEADGVDAFWVGSLARQLLRSSRFPLWVQHAGK